VKQQIQTPLIVVAVVVVVALFAWFGSKAFSAGDLDQGQVKYTPGKPPWEESDPSRKGPGGAPGGGGPGAPTGAPAPVPPGMGAPVVGNGN
jgi:hypothetical protein